MSLWERSGEMWPGWEEGQGRNWGAASQQVKWEWDNSMPPGSLAGNDGRGEMLKWGSTAPSAVWSVLPCAEPPCCLHCHRCLHPASSLLHSQHLPDKIFFTSSLPRGPRGLEVSSLMEGMPAAREQLNRWYMWEKKESFSLSLFNSENKIRCGDWGLASVKRLVVLQKLLWDIPESPIMSTLILS